MAIEPRSAGSPTGFALALSALAIESVLVAIQLSHFALPSWFGFSGVLLYGACVYAFVPIVGIVGAVLGIQALLRGVRPLPAAATLMGVAVLGGPIVLSGVLKGRMSDHDDVRRVATPARCAAPQTETVTVHVESHNPTPVKVTVTGFYEGKTAMNVAELLGAEGTADIGVPGSAAVDLAGANLSEIWVLVDARPPAVKSNVRAWLASNACR